MVNNSPLAQNEANQRGAIYWPLLIVIIHMHKETA